MERASARTGGVCPANDESDFGRCAAAVDQAERIGGDRVGGPSPSDTATGRELERQLHRLSPVTLEDWRWLARRLARAIENGWGREDMMQLAWLAAAG